MNHQLLENIWKKIKNVKKMSPKRSVDLHASNETIDYIKCNAYLKGSLQQKIWKEISHVKPIVSEDHAYIKEHLFSDGFIFNVPNNHIMHSVCSTHPEVGVCDRCSIEEIHSS